MVESGAISKVLFIVYLVFGLYLINMFFSFITMPEFITNLDNLIILVAGILVILGGINHLRLRKVKY